MAIAHRNTNTLIDANTAKVLTKPTGTASGDLLIAFFDLEDGFANNRTVSGGLPSGWAQMTNAPYDTGANWNRIFACYKVAGGSEPANYTFTFSGASPSSCSISAYSGVDTGTPFDATPVTFTGAASGTQTAPSISPANTGAMLICAFGAQTTAYGDAGYTPPGSMTERVEIRDPSFNCLYMADELLSASGATGTRAFTGNNDTQPQIGWSIVLKASAGGASDTPLTVTEGALSLAPQDVAMQAGGNITLPVTEAALTLPGQDILAVYEIVWTEGAITLAGQSIILIPLQNETLVVTEAALTLTGQTVQLLQIGDTALLVDVGALTLTGQDVQFAVGAGSVLVDVVNALLTLGGQSIDLNPSFTISSGGTAKRENMRRHGLYTLMNKGI